MGLRDFPDRPAIGASQLEHLRTLLAEIFPGNRFYSRKLQDAGLTFDVGSIADFQKRFPFTTKQELVADQAEHPPFGSNLTYPLSRYPRFHQTSGTTARPLRWLDTPESWENMIEDWRKIFEAAQVTAADRIYFAFSFGPFIGFWLAFEAAARIGCLCLPGGGLGTTARLRAILDNGATVICCTPTYALRLGETAAREKISLQASKVKTFLVAGEAGGSLPAIRERIASQWPGARVFDHHGMTETGPVSFECPARPGVLHIIETSFLPEVINPETGRTAGEGETGELVLTTLGRIGSPLLRYRTGDLVKADPEIAKGKPCACGRLDMALEGGILGRSDDMVIIRGVNVFPSAVDQIVRSFSEICEYQAEVKNVGALPELSICIELVPDSSTAAAIARRLEGELTAALSLRIPVSIAPAGTLPRAEMKSRGWIVASRMPH